MRRGCLDCLRETQAESAVTVVPAGAKHPDWSLELRETSRIHYANSRLAANRQNLRPVFHLSGACRCTWRTALQRAAHASSSEYWWDVSLDVAGFVVDETDYVHIDSRRDLEWAEYLLTRSASYSSSNQGEPTT